MRKELTSAEIWVRFASTGGSDIFDHAKFADHMLEEFHKRWEWCDFGDGTNGWMRRPEPKQGSTP